MQNLRIHSIRKVIQGEGFWTGLPVILVRCQGCNLRCTFCDTRYAQGDEGGTIYSPEGLVAQIKAVRGDDMVSTILLTGGEPLTQNIPAFLAAVPHTYRVHLETNATMGLPVNYRRIDWITASPKPDCPPNPVVIRHANELKWLVGKPSDINELLAFLSYFTVVHVFVQPIDGVDGSTDLAYDAAIRYGWRLSLQTHKLIGKD